MEAFQTETLHMKFSELPVGDQQANVTFALRKEESLQHLFLECKYALWLWSVLFFKLDLRIPTFSDLTQLSVFLISEAKKEASLIKLISPCFCAILYHLWGERNK